MKDTVFDPLSEQLLVDAREREASTLTRAERLTYRVSSAGFVLCALLLLVFGRDAGLPEAWVVAVLVGSYALASRLEFEVGSTLAIASELILVEMMFLLPPAQLPLWVLAGGLLGALPDYLRRTVPLERMLIVVGSSWYAFGPAIVLTLFPVTPSTDGRTLLVVGLALAAQFGTDLVSSALREWAALRVSPRQLASQMALVFSIDLALAPLGLLAAIASVHDRVAVLLPLPLLFMIALSTRERHRRMDQAIELSSAYRGTAFLLGDVVEADDEYTGAHSRDVVELVLEVCDEMKVDARARLDAEFVALLHDVGKINVPAEIINKPGPLDPDERAIMNLHTIDGERLLRRVGGRLADVGSIVRSCHERWDGGGYPDGLTGTAIPLVARIVCACDAFSAMTTNRSYRAARSVADAVAELEACAGSHFDPEVVAALATVVRSRPDWAARARDLVAAAAPTSLAA